MPRLCWRNPALDRRDHLLNPECHMDPESFLYTDAYAPCGSNFDAMTDAVYASDCDSITDEQIDAVCAALGVK